MMNFFFMQEEIKFYNNREQCRDLFYSLVRDAAAAYSAFGSGALESELGGFNKMKESANQFLRGLLPDNYPWFAGEPNPKSSAAACPARRLFCGYGWCSGWQHATML